MEQLPINNGCGQSFGFILYRKDVLEPQTLEFTGEVRDRAVVSYFQCCRTNLIISVK